MKNGFAHRVSPESFLIREALHAFLRPNLNPGPRDRFMRLRNSGEIQFLRSFLAVALSKVPEPRLWNQSVPTIPNSV